MEPGAANRDSIVHVLWQPWALYPSLSVVLPSPVFQSCALRWGGWEYATTSTSAVRAWLPDILACAHGGERSRISHVMRAMVKKKGGGRHDWSAVLLGFMNGCNAVWLLSSLAYI